MSFVSEMKSLYKRIKSVGKISAKEHEEINKQITEAGHGVDLKEKDQVIVTVAQEYFEGVYPTPDSRKICNTTSVPTAMVSAMSNLSFLASIGLFTYFFGTATGGWYAGDLVFSAYMTHCAMSLTVAGAAFGFGALLKKADRDMTMNLCLNAAEEDLDRDNKQLYHAVALQIEMDKIEAEAVEKLEPARALLRSLDKDVRDLWSAIKILQDEKGGSESVRSAKIRDLQAERNKIMDKCALLEENIARIEKKAEIHAGNVRIYQTTSRALSAASTINKLKSGALEEEINQLRSDSEERLALIAESTKNRRDELLIDIGLEDHGSLALAELEGGEEKNVLLPESTEERPLLITDEEED